MARLEKIHYQPMKLDPGSSSDLPWVVDETQTSISDLPQIFHPNGEPWVEANTYALDKLENGKKLKTVLTEMTHLRAYAEWLENENLDWRHFPLKKKHRCVFRYRGHLVDQRDGGELAPSVVSARMKTVERFYRWAWSEGLIERKALWEDLHKVIKKDSLIGLQRTFAVTTSELAIPNRQRAGMTLEDGLLPLSEESAAKLMEFMAKERMDELFWMFMIGFCTGARSDTIRTLRLSTLDYARPDPEIPNVMRVPVGPPTAVKTKLDVSGELIFPKGLIRQLEKYSTSARRLARQARSSDEDRTLLFLTRMGRKYTENTFTSRIAKLRKKLTESGHGEFERLKFHQSRASFGTWTVSRLLKEGMDPKTVLTFVRDAMLHKRESTTWTYITFVQYSPMKEKLSNEFFEFFSKYEDTLNKEEKINGTPA